MQWTGWITSNGMKHRVIEQGLSNISIHKNQNWSSDPDHEWSSLAAQSDVSASPSWSRIKKLAGQTI